MTSKERVMAVLKGKEPDRIPWAPLIDEYYGNYLKSRGLSLNNVEILRMIGADVIERHVHVFDRKYSGMEFETKRKGNEEILYITTPVGRLQQYYSYSGETKFCKGYMVNTLEDMKTMKYMYEKVQIVLDEKAFLKEQAYIGDDGIATASMEQTPILKLIEYGTGLENFTYLLEDYKTEMEELMETMHQSNLRLVRKLVESPAEVIIDYEDTSTTLISAEWYKKYCSRYIDEYADMIHDAGKVYITHMCGKLKGFTDIIRINRMDGIDSVCPPTTGDLRADEALKAFEGKFIIGGIDPPELKRMSVDETEKYVQDILNSIVPGRNFILSTGDATSYGTPVENLMKVSEMIKKYGGYPLKSFKG